MGAVVPTSSSNSENSAIEVAVTAPADELPGAAACRWLHEARRSQRRDGFARGFTSAAEARITAAACCSRFTRRHRFPSNTDCTARTQYVLALILLLHCMYLCRF